MKYRHDWQTERSYRWRVIEKCAHCGARRWLVLFRNKTGLKRQTYLYNPKFHDPWSVSQPDCKPKGKPALHMANKERRDGE